MRCSFVALTDGDCSPLDPTHYSSWLKLRRIQAWVNRFVQNCKKKPAARMIGELSADKVKSAEVPADQTSTVTSVPRRMEGIG